MSSQPLPTRTTLSVSLSFSFHYIYLGFCHPSSFLAFLLFACQRITHSSFFSFHVVHFCFYAYFPLATICPDGSPYLFSPSPADHLTWTSSCPIHFLHFTLHKLMSNFLLLTSHFSTHLSLQISINWSIYIHIPKWPICYMATLRHLYNQSSRYHFFSVSQTFICSIGASKNIATQGRKKETLLALFISYDNKRILYCHQSLPPWTE